MTHVTCRLTAKNRDQLRNPTLGNRVWAAVFRVFVSTSVCIHTQEVLAEMRTVVEGVVDAILYPSITDKSKNRGFAFVEFDSHRAAAMARRKLLPGHIPLWGQPVAVDWAEPEHDVDEDVMATVSTSYAVSTHTA